MTRQDLVDKYTEYLADIGRTQFIADNDKLTAEIGEALDCCAFYTGYPKFVCFDAELETMFTNYGGDVVALPVPFLSMTELKLDDVVIADTNYDKIMFNRQGLFNGLMINKRYITVYPAMKVEVTGVFGRIRTLTSYEEKLLFRLANGLAGFDVKFNIFMNSGQVLKEVAGSESITFKTIREVDQTNKILSYFHDVKAILVKYKKFTVK